MRGDKLYVELESIWFLCIGLARRFALARRYVFVGEERETRILERVPVSAMLDSTVPCAISRAPRSNKRGTRNTCGRGSLGTALLHLIFSKNFSFFSFATSETEFSVLLL